MCRGFLVVGQLNNRLSSCAPFKERTMMRGEHDRVTGRPRETTPRRRHPADERPRRDSSLVRRDFASLAPRHPRRKSTAAPSSHERWNGSLYPWVLCVQAPFSSSSRIIISDAGFGTLEGRRRRSCLGVHKSEPDFQHLLQSRKTTVWNDFDYMYRRSLCMPPLSFCLSLHPSVSLSRSRRRRLLIFY